MRNEYNTRQKRELMSFLNRSGLSHFTVDDLILSMSGEGVQVGRTTAYRFLETLSEQGAVRKYQSAQGVTFYQHIENDERCGEHLHMMCKRCGELYHVDCELVDMLTDHILSEHGFAFDARDTVFIGVCSKCAGAEKTDKDD